MTTVQEALKEFYGKDPKAKQTVINKIFAGTSTSNFNSNDKDSKTGGNEPKVDNFVMMKRGSAAQLAMIR